MVVAVEEVDSEADVVVAVVAHLAGAEVDSVVGVHHEEELAAEEAVGSVGEVAAAAVELAEEEVEPA